MKKLNIIKIGKKILILYHGTSDIKAKKIKSKGLKSSVDSPVWYVLSSHIDDAIFHSVKSKGSPVIIKFEVPYDDFERWKGYPYLWPPYDACGNFKGEWYALKQPLPSKFIKKIIPVTREDLKRVKG